MYIRNKSLSWNVLFRKSAYLINILFIFDRFFKIFNQINHYEKN